MKPLLKNFMLMGMMVAASGIAVAMRPTERLAESGPPVELERMIPREFGNWREEPQNQALIVDPQQQELVNRVYTQTLTRTYVSSEGERIMLSIAYGNDQSDSKQVHRPEICYPAQGFTLKNKQQGEISTQSGTIPVTRIETRLGQRNEPVTYWITVGDRIANSRLDKKLAEMEYGLFGKIPDGLLFRVSSIDNNPTRAYERQGAFTNQLLGALTPEHRQKFIGTPK